MSSVSKRDGGAAWQANYRDIDGKRRNTTTKVPQKFQFRDIAQTISDIWEKICKKEYRRQDLEDRAQQVITDIHHKLKTLSPPVVAHFEKKTTALLDEAYPIEETKSFASVAKDWLTDKKPRVKDSSFLAYQNQISDFSNFIGSKAELPLSEFDRAWLRAFQSDQASRISNKTANKKVKCVAAMLRWAYRQEIINENHADRIEHLPVKKKLKNGRNTERDFENLSFHCLRYTAATLLHECGVSQSVAQQIIGHDCEYIHSLYVKIRPDVIRKATEKLTLDTNLHKT
jgi:integrase